MRIDPRTKEVTLTEIEYYELLHKNTEPASEDLEDAINNYCLNVRKGYPRIEGNKVILEPKEISLTKETVIKILELYRSIHRDILKKIEGCDNSDVVDMGDEYVAEEIVKRYLKECINKKIEI